MPKLDERERELLAWLDAARGTALEEHVRAYVNALIAAEQLGPRRPAANATGPPVAA